MTYIFVSTCWGPKTYSSVRGLWQDQTNNNYYISADLKEEIPPDLSQQYMLIPPPVSYTTSKFRNTLLNSPQILTQTDLNNKFVLYFGVKWTFDLPLKTI
jgi:hypothetical protein